MIPIDRQVQQTMGAFKGQPDKLMQRYKQGNNLIDLLALQQMKSDMDAVKQQMVLSQQQMPGTIREQREQEVLAGYKEKAGRQVGDVAKNTAGLLNQRQASVNANMQRQGITQQPTRAASNGGLMKMAGGGIVGFAEGRSVTSEIIKDLGITPDRWAKMSDEEKQQVMDILDAQSAVGQIGSGAKVFGGLPFFMQDFALRTGQDLANKFRTSNIGKALGLSEFDEETPEEAKTVLGSALEEMEDRSRMQQRRSDPNVFLEDIDAAVNVLAAKEQGAEAGPPIPKDYEALTQDQVKKIQQDREEYDPTALLQTLQKQGVTPPVVPEAKPPGSALPDPNADKSEGLGSLKPKIPAKEEFDPAAVQARVNPILDAYGLGGVGNKTFTDARDEARAESDTYLDRAGVKQIRQDQLDELEGLKQKQLDPETLKRDNVLRGLIAASGGGNFAAVGQGIFNAEDAQAVQERNFLKEKFGIQDNLLDTDLEIAMKGIDSGNQAVDILSKQQQAAAKIVSDFSVEELKDMRERSKQKFESGQNAIANRLKQSEIDAIAEYRKAVTDNQKLNILIDQTAEISTTISTAIEMDADLAALKQEIRDDPDDQSLKDEYELLLQQKQIEIFDMLNMSGLFDLVERIKTDLGLAAGSAGASGFGPVTRQP